MVKPENEQHAHRMESPGSGDGMSAKERDVRTSNPGAPLLETHICHDQIKESWLSCTSHSGESKPLHCKLRGPRVTPKQKAFSASSCESFPWSAATRRACRTSWSRRSEA